MIITIQINPVINYKKKRSIALWYLSLYKEVLPVSLTNLPQTLIGEISR